MIGWGKERDKRWKGGRERGRGEGGAGPQKKVLGDSRKKIINSIFKGSKLKYFVIYPEGEGKEIVGKINLPT